MDNTGKTELIAGDLCEIDGGVHAGRRCIYLSHVKKRSHVYVFSSEQSFKTCIGDGNIKFVSRWLVDNGYQLRDHDGCRLERKVLKKIRRELKDCVFAHITQHQRVHEILNGMLKDKKGTFLENDVPQSHKEDDKKNDRLFMSGLSCVEEDRLGISDGCLPQQEKIVENNDIKKRITSLCIQITLGHISFSEVVESIRGELLKRMSSDSYSLE